MSNITYPSKAVSGSGTAVYKEGQTLPAGELQADFDAVATIVNGQLDEDNLKAGTQIPNSKLATIDPANVDDNAATESAFLVNTTPGDSLSLTLPTDLTDELEMMRYVLRTNKGYASNTQAFDDVGALNGIGWVEEPLQGTNLLPNDGFEVQSGAANSAPDGWTLIGTPSTAAIFATPDVSAGSEKRSFRLVMASNAEGITTTIKGIRANRKYLFGCAYTRVNGTVAFDTAGGLDGGNNYADFKITDAASSAYIVRQGVVQSDSTGRDIAVSIYGDNAGGNEFRIHNAWFYELSVASPRNVPHIPSQVATHSTEEVLPNTFTVDVFNWENVDELDLSQYIPSEGYRLIYEVTLCYTGATGITDSGGGFGQQTAVGRHSEYGFRIQMDDGTGIATVDGPYIDYFANNGASNVSQGGVLTMKHIVENPTPGLTYAFTTDVGAYNFDGGQSDQQMMLSPLAGHNEDNTQGISKARLIVERV